MGEMGSEPEERLLDEVTKGVLWPEVASEFLAAVPDGWAKQDGHWRKLEKVYDQYGNEVWR